MGYIHCCAGLRKAKSYALIPDGDYLLAQADYLEACPICSHTVLQITRINLNNEVSICRKVNKKARKLFDKLKSSIMYEKTTCYENVRSHSKFYLNYNEYGVKKKCYSNLSTLRLGMFEDKSLVNYAKNKKTYLLNNH